MHNCNVAHSSLPPEDRGLVALMHAMGFGQIHGLHVCEGKPLFDPAPRLLREIKLGAESNPPRPRCGTDFLLRAEVRELFAHLAQLRTGVILLIEVRHGLPVKMVFEDGRLQQHYN